MFHRLPGSRLLSACLAALLSSSGLSVQAELRYRCGELEDMAEEFFNLKHRGYSLEAIVAVVGEAAADNPEKENLLTDLAIEIYVDPDIASPAAARALAEALCDRDSR